MRHVPTASLSVPVLVVLVLSLLLPRASAQLFENLDALGARLDAGDPEVISTWRGGNEGPKGIVTGDFDGDGLVDLAASNLDGTVTLYLNRGDNRFAGARHLRTGMRTLRGIVAADFTGDGLPDIAVAAPLDARLALFVNRGGAFGEPLEIETWEYARDLAAGDFDGDGAADLVIGGSLVGLRQLRGRGDGSFERVAESPELATFTGIRPVYTLHPVRFDGEQRDSLLATHAWSEDVWVLSPDDSGRLRVRERVCTAISIYEMGVGPITQPVDGAADLVTASRDLGIIEIHRSAAGPMLFQTEASQRIAVPGGPRAFSIVDLDGDGWNDLVVVLRRLNLVMTYHNEQGFLVPTTEMPVGMSPRALAAADFNADGQPDYAVINRVSLDISIVSGYSGTAGFGSSDQVYFTDGEVSDLRVADLNGDGRDDVLQVHRASSEVSVRLAGPGGRLEAPVYYGMGTLTTSIRLLDFNHDGAPDIISSNMGRADDGSIAVRAGDGRGGFSEARVIHIPAHVGGQFFGIDVADFDGDGIDDVVVGFFDCRIGLFKGAGDGHYNFTSVHLFVYEPRALTVGDFDGDGDVDLAGASYTGMVLVVENQGDLLTTSRLARTEYPPPDVVKFGTNAMRSLDVDQDGDLDLIVGSGHGVMVYTGREGMRFELSSETLPGTEFPASSVTTADFDGDGKPDLAVACQVLSCIVILTQREDGRYVPALSVDVPAGRLLAAGDVDGDGHTDLVGSGAVLWTALSSRRAEGGSFAEDRGERPKAPGPVINEILAINNLFPVPGNEGRKPDWLEIYNGAGETVSLAGWKVVREKIFNTEGSPPRIYTFPDGARIESKGYLLLTFTRTQRTEYHTGFRMPGEGGILCLFDDQGVERDRVVLPTQFPNISYARFEDGGRAFAFNNYPSPLEENRDNGPVAPTLALDTVATFAGVPEKSAEALTPDTPIQFIATGRDDEGIVAVTVMYQRLDVPDPELHRVILYDDGFHGDGGMQDGLFAGTLESGLPRGASIRYRIEVQDLSDVLTVLPDSRAPSSETGSDGFYTLSMDATASPLRLSEIVARNDTGVRDDEGGTPDWVEIRNCGEEPASLGGILLGTTFPASDRWFRCPDVTLDAGQYLIIYCDDNRDAGPLHTPFTLPRSGGTVVLAGTNDLGAHWLIDRVEYPEIDTDTSYARLRCGGEWTRTPPTPAAPNRLLAGDASGDGAVNVTDAIALLGFLFSGAPLPCAGAANVTGSDDLNISDAVYLLLYLFASGPAPENEPTGC